MCHFFSFLVELPTRTILWKPDVDSHATLIEIYHVDPTAHTHAPGEYILLRSDPYHEFYIVPDDHPLPPADRDELECKARQIVDTIAPYRDNRLATYAKADQAWYNQSNRINEARNNARDQAVYANNRTVYPASDAYRYERITQTDYQEIYDKADKEFKATLAQADTDYTIANKLAKDELNAAITAANAAYMLAADAACQTANIPMPWKG